MSSYSFLANVEAVYLVCAEVIVKAAFPNSPLIVDMILNLWCQFIVLPIVQVAPTVIPFFRFPWPQRSGILSARSTAGVPLLWAFLLARN